MSLMQMAAGNYSPGIRPVTCSIRLFLPTQILKVRAVQGEGWINDKCGLSGGLFTILHPTSGLRGHLIKSEAKGNW